MSTYQNAKDQHDHIKYHYEKDIKRFAPHVPIIQVLMLPPKGKYCNPDHTFCPHLLWGGFCEHLYKNLLSIDGGEFTTITNVQFWKCFGDENATYDAPDHNVAVGCYKVFRKQCGINTKINRRISNEN